MGILIRLHLPKTKVHSQSSERGCLCTILVIAQESEKIIQGRCRGGYFLLLILVASCLSQETMGTKLDCLNLSVLVIISDGSERNG